MKKTFKNEQEYQTGIARLNDLKSRLTKASQNRVSGMGLSPMYSELKREIDELGSMVNRYKATQTR